MKTEDRNDVLLDRDNHLVEFWAFLLEGRLIGLTYTGSPQWTVTYVDPELLKEVK